MARRGDWSRFWSQGLDFGFQFNSKLRLYTFVRMYTYSFGSWGLKLFNSLQYWCSRSVFNYDLGWVAFFSEVALEAKVCGFSLALGWAAFFSEFALEARVCEFWVLSKSRAFLRYLIMMNTYDRSRGI